ncbi:MAG: DUF58 domain-containing protein [candidate division Zixibacteria bacterium]|jgi:uncharacterized protein (DUF58 family)|nr:DUF58 domain-containing protein [candidate division Zixibacteria bacterium]
MAVVSRDILKKVRLIEIRTRRLVNDMFSGEYHSSFKGRGMEFDEVREYQIGDDVRQIDWNVTARSGVPYIKKFTEERELSVVFLIDASGSQKFGSGKNLKSELAAELTALLSLAAIKNNDKVGMIIFTDRIEKFVPPAKGRKHVLRLIREVLYFKPEGRGTDIAGALEFYLRLIKRRSVAFLISDFQADDYSRQLLLAGKKHDLVALKLTDPREMEIPSCGMILFEDAESGQTLWLDSTDPRFRAEFKKRNYERQAQMEKLFKQNNVDFINLDTSRSYIEPLIKFFKMREKRIH